MLLGGKTVDCLDLAKLFLIQANHDGISGTMTNMKLNKLLYYAQCLHLGLYDEPLFDEEIQAWIHGPVCTKVYSAYKQYVADPLPVPSAEELTAIAEENIAEENIEIVQEVWMFLGDRRASELRNMSHAEKPWLNARGDIPNDCPSKELLQISDMKQRGNEMVEQIETSNPLYQAMVQNSVINALAEEEAPTMTADQMNEWLDNVLIETI